MRATTLRTAAACFSFVLLALLSRPTAAQDLVALRRDVAAAGGRVIVGIRPGDAARGMAGPGVRALSRVQVQAIAERLTGVGLRVTRNYDLITAVAGVVSGEAVGRLLQDPNVEYVVPDRIHTLQLAGGPVAAPMPAVEQIPWGISRIKAPSAWTATAPANYGAGVKVGILDTGGDFDHEDLAYAGGFDAVLGSTAPADWDDNLPACAGHGTHVAGTVAAVRDNGLGVVGVAPGASVYAIQIFVEYPDPLTGFPQCGAFTSDIIAGVQWAAANGMQVVNMSYGGLGFDPAEHAAYQAAAAAGVHLVAAAGNSGLPASGFTPAAYPEVIAVSATDVNDNWAPFSNSGPEVFVAAPGVGVVSTLPGNTYAAYDGTSMASPHVTGLVALLLAINPTLSDASLRGLLGAGASDLGAAGRDDLFGEGRIDALASVGLATQQATSATHLALVQQPGNGTSGQPLLPAPTVELRDGQEQPVLQAGVVVTATVSSGPGRVTGLGRRLKKPGTGADSKRLPVEPATTAVVTNASGRAVFSSLTITTVVTAQHQLTFAAAALTPVVSNSFTVTGSVTTLANGVPVTGLGGAYNSLRYFVLTVPAGLGVLTVTTGGGTGDVDLAMQFGVPPTLGSWDCASAEIGNADNCSVSNPTGGNWYIVLFGYEAYAGVTLTATASGAGATQMALLQQPQNATSGQPLVPAPVVQLLGAQGQPVALAGVPVTVAISSGPGQVSAAPGRQAAKIGEAAGRPPVQPFVTTVVTDANGQAAFSDLTVTTLTTAPHQLVFSARNVTSLVSQPFTVTGTTPTALTNGVPVPGLSGAAGSTRFYVLTVPAGQGSLTVRTQGGIGDADLFVKRGALPTTASFDCVSGTVTNDEVCTIVSPAAGEWYILVLGYDPYAGLTLTATFLPPATQLAMVQQPGNATSLSPLVPAPVVQLLDAQSQPVAQEGVAVTAAISSGPGQLSGLAAGATPAASPAAGSKRRPAELATTTVVTDASGQAVFSDLTITTVTTAEHRLVFSSRNIASVVSDPFTVTGTPVTPLSNGVPLTGRAGTLGSSTYYVITVPAGQVDLTVTTGGGSGDVDLLVRRGTLPTFGNFDCLSESFTTSEVCNFTAPSAGDWYVMLYGFDDYAGVALTASYAVGAPLTVTLSGNGSGTVSGPNGLSCLRLAGQTTGTCSVEVIDHSGVQLYAQADTFSSGLGGWGGAASGCGVLPGCTVQISGPTSVSAAFVVQTTLTVTGSGTGRGTVAGGGINCSLSAGVGSGNCWARVPEGTAISLTGTPAAGEKFNGWAGDCTGTGPCQLTMTQDHNLQADFGHPPADVSRMVAELTGTPTLSSAEAQRWDCNSTATFDVGDLLCYLDNNPGVALTPQVMTAVLRNPAVVARRSAATGKAAPTRRED